MSRINDKNRSSPLKEIQLTYCTEETFTFFGSCSLVVN